MFKLRFKYNGNPIEILDCYGFSYSPSGRIMYVKYKKDGRLITQSFYTKFVFGLNFRFFNGGAYVCGKL